MEAPTAPSLDIHLSDREEEVLRLYGLRGLAVKQVAYELGLAEETVKSYAKRLREKARDAGIPCSTKIELHVWARHRDSEAE